jgi:3-methylcrotonyl-CoA carboxylase alpha subunit
VPKRLRLTVDAHEWIAEQDGSRISLSGVDTPLVAHDEGDGRFRVEGADRPMAGIAAVNGDVVWVSIDQQIFEIRFGSATARSGARAQDALTPPMSATVVRIAVKVGDHVKQGEPLIVLEAMKMELPIRAPHDGTIGAINCREGELVQPGTVLVEFST